MSVEVLCERWFGFSLDIMHLTTPVYVIGKERNWGEWGGCWWFTRREEKQDFYLKYWDSKLVKERRPIWVRLLLDYFLHQLAISY
jgi:hypothetical protein